jgi:hypothetical protein
MILKSTKQNNFFLADIPASEFMGIFLWMILDLPCRGLTIGSTTD